MKIKLKDGEVSLRQDDWRLANELDQMMPSDLRMLLKVFHWVSKNPDIKEEMLSDLRDIHKRGYPLVK